MTHDLKRKRGKRKEEERVEICCEKKEESEKGEWEVERGGFMRIWPWKNFRGKRITKKIIP